MNADLFRKEIAEILKLQDRQIVSAQKESASYKMAFDLYTQKEYRKASYLFTTLVLKDPFATHHWQGLASSKQMAREYEAAIQAWGLLAILNPQDPLPHYHAGQCLLAMKENEQAQKAFESALTLDPSFEIKIKKLKLHYDAN